MLDLHSSIVLSSELLEISLQKVTAMLVVDPKAVTMVGPPKFSASTFTMTEPEAQSQSYHFGPDLKFLHLKIITLIGPVLFLVQC